jgi:sugar phosphate isomerase/epimerase
LINELGEYARTLGVKLAIEPVDHWETPAPTLLHDVVRLLEGVCSEQVGVCIDSAHVMLGSQGPKSFEADAAKLAMTGRIHSIHLSAPDRGELADSWIRWQPFLHTVLRNYDGPLLVEVFNAIPVFLGSLRLTRRKFLIAGEDPIPDKSVPAYQVAEEAFAIVDKELARYDSSRGE